MGDPISVALVGLAALQGVASARGAAGQAEAAQEQARLNIAEVRRQQDDADTEARERRSDRVVQADRELASVLGSLAEGGGLGGTLGIRFAAEVGGAEGLDLARIEGTRRGKQGALESKVRVQERGARDSIAVAGVEQTAAGLEFLGTGLQIASRAKGQKEERERAKDLVN